MIRNCFLVAICILFIPSVVRAQALPAATRGGVLQVGGGFTNANPDYGPKRISGITGYATFDLGRHIGIEADIHYVSLFTPLDFGENSYEIGPRYVFHFRHAAPYAKALLGIGSGQFQQGAFSNNVHSSSYFEYAVGGGVDVPLGSKINLRLIDFELQRWPSFPPNALTPSLITVGLAYRLR